MPMISVVPKKVVDLQHNAIINLHEQCARFKLFDGKEPDDIYTYSVSDSYKTSDGPAMVAIAQYGDTYVIYAPAYLSDKQFVIFSYILREMEPHEKIIVFSQKSYDAVKERSHFGQPVNVELYV